MTEKINPDDFIYVQWVGKQPQLVHSPSRVMTQYTEHGKHYNSYGFSNQNKDKVLYIHKKDFRMRPHWFKKLTKDEETNFLKYNRIKPTDKEKDNFNKYGTIKPTQKQINDYESKNKTVEVKAKRGRKPSVSKV